MKDGFMKDVDEKTKKNILQLRDIVIEKLQEQLVSVVTFAIQHSKPNYKKIESYKKKYRIASKEFIANRLISSASKKTAVSGVVGGAVISAAELSTAITGGAMLATTGGAMAGDIIAATKIQMQLIIDIVALYECEFDLDDEEDVWLIFLLALGLQTKDDILKSSKIIFDEAGIKNLRRLLRYRSQRANIQKLAGKIFGGKAAALLAEKKILTLVPFANVVIGGGINSFTTTKLGEIAILYGKIRSSMFKHIHKMEAFHDKHLEMILYTLRYISEYTDSKRTLDDIAIVWRCTTARLSLSEEVIDEIEDIDDIKSEYKNLISVIENKEIKAEIYSIAETTIASLNKKDSLNYVDCLKTLAKVIGVEYDHDSFETKLLYFNKRSESNSKIPFKL